MNPLFGIECKSANQLHHKSAYIYVWIWWIVYKLYKLFCIFLANARQHFPSASLRHAAQIHHLCTVHTLELQMWMELAFLTNKPHGSDSSYSNSFNLWESLAWISIARFVFHRRGFDLRMTFRVKIKKFQFSSNFNLNHTPPSTCLLLIHQKVPTTVAANSTIPCIQFGIFWTGSYDNIGCAIVEMPEMRAGGDGTPEQ